MCEIFPKYLKNGDMQIERKNTRLGARQSDRETGRRA